MPPPTSYTEPQLVEFMVTDLGAVATSLEWDGTSLQLTEAAYDVAHWLGVSDVADYTTSAQTVRKLARYAAWTHALKSLAAHIDVAEDGQTYKESDLYKHAAAVLAQARDEAIETGLLPGYSIGRDTLLYPSADPYTYYPDEDRVVVTP